MTNLEIILIIFLIVIFITVLIVVLNINKKVKDFPQKVLADLKIIPDIKSNLQEQKENIVQNTQEVVKEIYPNLFTPGNKWDYRSPVRPGYSGVISMRNIDYPYQQLTTPYLRVGTANSESKTDDTVMTLYRRDIAPERDWYEYKVIDTTAGSNIEIYLNPSITYLKNGEKIIIPGYENKGEFVVNLDSQYSYMRLNPYPSYRNFY